MPLIRNGAFVADGFTEIADDAALPVTGGVILSCARFLKEREEVLKRRDPVGVRLNSDESPERIADDLPNLAVVVLEFPRFRDGRAFSWARMLRTRFGFTREIRASGHFLYDQIAFMLRTGFDAIEVPDGFTLDLFRRATSEMSGVYQPSVDGRKTIREMRAGR